MGTALIILAIAFCFIGLEHGWPSFIVHKHYHNDGECDCNSEECNCKPKK